jgi:hypothetical protein
VRPITGTPAASVKPNPASHDRPKPVWSMSPSTPGRAESTRLSPETDAAWKTNRASHAATSRAQAHGRARLNRRRKRAAASESVNPAARTAGVHTKRRIPISPMTAMRAAYQVKRTAP